MDSSIYPLSNLINPLIHSFIRPTIHPSIELSNLYPSICPSIHLSKIYPSVHPSIHLSNLHPFTQYLSIYLYNTYLSIHTYIHLSVHQSIDSSIHPTIIQILFIQSPSLHSPTHPCKHLSNLHPFI